MVVTYMCHQFLIVNAEIGVTVKESQDVVSETSEENEPVKEGSNLTEDQSGGIESNDDLQSDGDDDDIDDVPKEKIYLKPLTMRYLPNENERM